MCRIPVAVAPYLTSTPGRPHLERDGTSVVRGGNTDVNVECYSKPVRKLLNYKILEECGKGTDPNGQVALMTCTPYPVGLNVNLLKQNTVPGCVNCA